MRRVLLFLAIFGAGLAILLLAARWRDRGEPLPGPPALPLRDPPVTFPDPEAGVEGQIGVVLQGELEFTRYARGRDELGERPRLFHVEAGDVQPVEADMYDLAELVVRMFEPETSTLRAVLTSPRTRTRVASVAGAPNFAEEDRVEFQDVRLDLVSGADIVPAILRVPTLEADLAARTFRSDERVTFEGRGLDAEGTGLFGSEEPYLLRFERDGEVTGVLPHGGRVRLSSAGPGPIEIRRLEHLPADERGLQRDLVRVRATEGARLVVSDEQELSVSAETLELHGVVVDQETFRVLAAHAEGDVQIQRDQDVFSGQRADFSFASDGRLSGVALEGEPRGTLYAADPRARPADPQDPGEPEEPAEPVRVEIQSEGVLELDLLGRASFRASGPTRVEAPDLELVLEASRRMAGSVDRELGVGDLVASGDVQGRFAEWRFVGQDLRVDVEREEGEEPLVRATTRRPARITGQDEESQPVTLDVEAGFDFLMRGEELEVPLARTTRLVVEGEDGFELEAGEVRDLDWLGRRFNASGGVRYRGRGVTAVAREARTLEDEEIELLAGPADPVRVDLLPPGLGGVRRASLRGQRVLLTHSRAVAEGRVHAEVQGEAELLALDARRIELERVPDPEDPDSPYTPWKLSAEEVVRGRLEGPFGEADFAAAHLRAAGQAMRLPEAERPETVVDYLEATGSIELDWRGDVRASARGERFVYDGHARRGRLEAAAGELVEAHGRLPGNGPAYRLFAESVELERGAVRASRVRATLEDEGAPRRQHKQAQEPRLDRLDADWLSAEEDTVHLSGNVLLEGRLDADVPWSLRAAHVWVERAVADEPLDPPAPEGREIPIRQLVAWGGFDLRYGQDLRGTGELLEVLPERLRMEGVPARLEVGGLVWEAPLVEYDAERVLVTAERGRVVGGEERFQGWTLEYESLQPFEQLDSTIIVLRGPRLVYEDREVRAGWALLWVDRDAWAETTADWLLDPPAVRDLRIERADEPTVEPAEPAPPGEGVNLFNRLDLSEIAPILNEIYIEGNVEYLEAGDRRARVESVYFDLIDGHGWLRDAELYIDIEVRGQPGRVVVAAEWLRHSADGSLRGDNATVTTCTHEVPHFVVRTRDLRITPDPETEDVVYDVSLRRNALRFRGGWGIPLPPVSYPSDGRGLPVLPALRIGDSARFGRFLEATFSRDLGPVGDAVGRAMGAEEDDLVEARARYRASYLGSRGAAAGVGAEISTPDQFWLNAYLDAVYDTGQDRGLVRVPTEDRGDLRTFWRFRGRVHLDPEEWLDVAFAQQSDAGVQAEFFEGDFLEYEERDTYLHWRKAWGPSYYSASTKLRVDDFRNEVEELPSLGAFRGLTPLFDAFGRSVYFRGSLDAAYLRRKITDSDAISPFDPVFEDGVTEDRTVQRVDAQGRLEMPLPLGRSGLTFTPFTAVRSTLWSEGIDPESSPGRHAALAGADLGTTFWRRTRGGWLHDLTPRLGVRTDLLSSTSDGPPLPIDLTEDPIEGRFVDANLRLRWWRPDAARHLDLDVRATHAADRPDGEPDGFLPVAVLGQFLTEIGGDPVGLLHDGRYDSDGAGTIFNRTALGWEPSEKLAFETGYARGVHEPLGTLYEAVTFAVRLRGSGSWEAEGRQTLSLRDGGSLDTRLLLRRYGHDLIFELEIGRRSGEGGTTISLSIDPVLGWRRPRLGLLDAWLRG